MFDVWAMASRPADGDTFTITGTRPASGEWPDLERTGHVRVEYAGPPGRRRPYAVCPTCGERARRLFAFFAWPASRSTFPARLRRRGWPVERGALPWTYACRACHGLRYASTYEQDARGWTRHFPDLAARAGGGAALARLMREDRQRRAGTW